jgi:cbb3-type cytochrome oxidase subunit 3
MDGNFVFGLALILFVLFLCFFYRKDKKKAVADIERNKQE